jgi:hypothetical protein
VGAVSDLTNEEHVARLEADVETFARHLAEAQADDVSHAIILPRLMLAFRRSFGEPPPGFVLPGLPVGS